MTTSYQYNLTVQNQSSNGGTMVVYQQDAGLGVDGLLPLAWMTEPVNPTTTVVFSWSVCYDFAWYHSGLLAPGIHCVASQVWPAGLSSDNQVTLTKNANGFTFQNQTAGPTAGDLYVSQDGTIPAEIASVGIGMAGSGTFVTQAQPNLMLDFQSPDPGYRLFFSQQHVATGEVLDVAGITGPQTPIEFPRNVYAMTATLGTDNQWSVQPTSAADAARLAATTRTELQP